MQLRIATALALLAAGAGALVVAPAPADVAPQLPDLDPVAPYQVTSFTQRRGGRKRFHLAFGSAAENVGTGRLTIVGHRPDTTTPLMSADQIVASGDPATNAPGPDEVVPGIGVMRYVRSPSHSHWHLLGFMRYELRRASSFRRVRRDRKTGFCLGDRYTAGVLSLRRGRAAGTRDECGPDQPGLLQVAEGISPRRGDDYQPRLEGQSIDITGLASGEYLLVHRVNVEGRIRESNYANNVSSALISIRRRGARRGPFVEVLAACTATARCD